jgi:NADH:ubiquinone oxidoreductase subunit 3 (subunit A)
VVGHIGFEPRALLRWKGPLRHDELDDNHRYGMLSAFLAAATVTAAATLGTMVMLAVARRWSPHASSAPQRVPVLGGFEPQTHAWSRFHVRYYPMALLFIAFEMEMMFMYPWAVVFVEEGAKALVEMGMFLGILAVGVIYGWREGVFRWQ